MDQSYQSRLYEIQTLLFEIWQYDNSIHTQILLRKNATQFTHGNAKLLVMCDLQITS